MAVKPESDDTQAEEPTIQVSIGRVEVRAVQPQPTPRRRPERPAPMLSLDDYLQRHGRPE